MPKKDLGKIICEIKEVNATVDSGTGVPSASATVTGTLTEKIINFEFKNLKGDKPVKGVDYYTPAEKEQFTNDTKAIVQVERTKVVEQIKSIVAGNPATTNALTLSGKTRVEFEQDLAQILEEKVIIPIGEPKIGYYRYTDLRYIEDSNYYTSEFIEIPNVLEGTDILLRSSFGLNDGGVLLLDKDKKVIDYIVGLNSVDKGYINNSTIQDVKIKKPVNAKYIVTTIRTAFFTSKEKDFAIKCKVTKANVYDGAITNEKLADNSITNEKLADNLIENKMCYLGKNKFNYKTSENGFINDYHGNIFDSSIYKTSDYIDISEFKNNICISPRIRKALQYDENKQSIKVTLESDTINNPVLIKNVNAKYIRFSYFTEDENKVQLEDAISPTSFEKFSLKLKEGINALNDITTKLVEDKIHDLTKKNEDNINSLKNKKWCHFGDSFSDYANKKFETGTFAKKDMTYPRIIADKNGMILDENFFQSGRTMAYPADKTFDNSATSPNCRGYYQNIPEDVDYVTIMLGINDVNHINGSGTTPDGEDATGKIDLGTINDTTTNTYYGAYNTVLGWLRENRPFAHIGIIVTNGTERETYVKAQIELAKKWGYPYLNLNGDERTPAFIRCWNPNISNELKNLLKAKQGVDSTGTITGSINLHPNWQTHLLESTIVENFLKSL